MAVIKVMLVDDDYLVLRDLKSMVDWEALGFHIVALARNGKHALELFRKHRPQLIICDISMPVIDGLDFIETLRSEYTDVQIIILSSYEEFSFAKRAIKSNVLEYLLKNDLTKETLGAKLLEAALLFDNKRNEKRRLISAALNEFFHSSQESGVFFEANRFDGTTLRELKRLIEQKMRYQVFMLHSPLGKTERRYRYARELGSACYRSSWERLSANPELACVFYSGSFLTIGYAEPASEGYGQSKKAKELMKIVSRDAPHRMVAFYIPGSISLSEFREAFRQRAEIIQYYSIFPKSSTVDLSDCMVKSIPFAGGNFDYSLIQSCVQEPDLMCERMERYVSGLFESKDIVSLYQFFSDMLFKYEELSGQSGRYDEPYYFVSESECVDFLKREYAECVAIWRGMNRQQYSSSLMNALYFIDQNFQNKDLTIEQVAEHIRLSAGRLSTLFKKETGKTINGYITDKRIEYAIHLLKTSNLKIYEVAEQVGYQSAQYFSQVLGKQTGKRPIDFKKPSAND